MGLRNCFTRHCCLSRDVQNHFRWSSLEQFPLQIFQERRRIQASGLVEALKACGICKEIEIGKRLHFHAAENGDVQADLHVANTLLHMYAKCGSVVAARSIFEGMVARDLVSWNVLMQGYAVSGDGKTALDLFSRMVSEGCEPDARSFVAAAVACSNLAARETGKQVEGRVVKVGSLAKGMEIHSQAVNSGFTSNIFVASAFIDMYSKCGSLLDARVVFDCMKAHNVVSWTSLISGYVEHDQAELVLKLFRRMRGEGCAPNCRTYVAALMACTSLAEKQDPAVKSWCLGKGMWIHSQAVKNGFGSDIFVGSALVDMYAKCGRLVYALNVFESLQHRDVILWNALILGFVDEGEYETALELVSRMERTAGCEPDARTYVAALTACSCLAVKEDDKERWLKKGMALHAKAREKNLDTKDVFVACSLVDMYSKCGSMGEACCVFDRMQQHDSVLWNSLINGYVQNGQPDAALSSFARMQSEGREPDARTVVSALMSCTSSAAKVEDQEQQLQFLKRGMEIHWQARKTGLESDAFVASSLVEMYAKCGSLEDAQRVFDSMKKHDVVVWGCLIMGYAENGEGEIALELLHAMKSQGCEPNSRTYVAALLASGTELEFGKHLHGEMCRRGVDDEEYAGNSLLDFYGRCGDLDDAEQVFESMVERKMVAWSSLISAYSRRGDSCRVLELVGEMGEQGVKVDGVTMKSVLATCSHAGLVDKGKKCLAEMVSRYGVEPEIEHFHCVVDMLGRANMLDEAMKVVESMPFRATAVTWKTILAACRKWRNVDVGKVAFKELIELDERHEAGYVLMSNLYASLGMWEEQLKVLELKEKANSLAI